MTGGVETAVGAVGARMSCDTCDMREKSGLKELMHSCCNYDREASG
jgi:hypothetical protein